MNLQTSHINLYDLAFLGAIFIGLTFALLLWLVQKINKYANRFLALAVVVMVLWVVQVLSNDIRIGAFDLKGDYPTVS